MTEPTTAAGRALLDRLTIEGREHGVASAIAAIEAEARFKHTDPEMQDRCDGRCATDECVCPEGGWHAECDRIAAAERARLAGLVRALRVKATKYGETPWQEGFRQSRNETVAAVLALLEEKP